MHRKSKLQAASVWALEVLNISAMLSKW